jgi:hypothetical protein
MPRQNMDAMLWFAGRWWWFPTASIDLDSAVFEWRDNRVYLLEPDHSAAEGILFVGEVAPIDALQSERRATSGIRATFI